MSVEYIPPSVPLILRIPGIWTSPESFAAMMQRVSHKFQVEGENLRVVSRDFSVLWSFEEVPEELSLLFSELSGNTLSSDEEEELAQAAGMITITAFLGSPETSREILRIGRAILRCGGAGGVILESLHCAFAKEDWVWLSKRATQEISAVAHFGASAYLRQEGKNSTIAMKYLGLPELCIEGYFDPEEYRTWFNAVAELLVEGGALNLHSFEEIRLPRWLPEQGEFSERDFQKFLVKYEKSPESSESTDSPNSTAPFGILWFSPLDVH